MAAQSNQPAFFVPLTSKRFATWALSTLVERAANLAFLKGGRSHAAVFVGEVKARVGESNGAALVADALAALCAEASEDLGRKVTGVWDLS